MSYFDNPLTEKRERESKGATTPMDAVNSIKDVAPAFAALLEAVKNDLEARVTSGDGEVDAFEAIGIPRPEFASGGAILLAAAATLRDLDPTELFKLIQQFPWLPGCMTDTMLTVFMAGRKHAEQEAAA